MKYRKKPVVIEAITFDEFVQYGRDHSANIINDMPWSFEYKGHPVTHENNQCYLIPTLEGTHNFTPEDMLITGVKGEIYSCKLDIFAATYEKVALLTVADTERSNGKMELYLVLGSETFYPVGVRNDPIALGAIASSVPIEQPMSERERKLQAMLLTVLDQVDYTAGACGLTEMVGAVLPKEVIVLARKALAAYEGEGK